MRPIRGTELRGKAVRIPGADLTDAPANLGRGNGVGSQQTQGLTPGVYALATVTVNAQKMISDVTAGTAGTVTSVGLSLPAQFTISGSPVTGSGTLTATWANQTANKVLASPNGSTGTPTFRALVAADIPNIAESQVTGLVSDLAAKVSTSRTISTTLPLTGGGDLSANRTLDINNFTGDSGSGGLKGTVPAPAAGDAAANKFLKATGAWAALAAADIPNLDAAKITTGQLAIANGGTAASTAAGARTNLGAAASGVNTDITQLNGASQVDVSSVYKVGGVQVLAARDTGWTAPTGTPSKAGYATSTATLTQVAETLKALVDAAIAAGWIGA